MKKSRWSCRAHVHQEIQRAEGRADMKAVAIVKRAFQAYYADLRYYIVFAVLAYGFSGAASRGFENILPRISVRDTFNAMGVYVFGNTAFQALIVIPITTLTIAVRVMGGIYPGTLGSFEKKERLRRILSAYAALLLSRACFYMANSLFIYYESYPQKSVLLFSGVIVLAISPAMAFSTLAALKNGRGPIGAIRQGMAAFYRHPVKYFLPFFAFAAGSRLFQQCFSWLGTAAADGFLAVFPFNEELVLSVSAQLYIRYAVENMFLGLTEPIVMAAALQTFVFFENADAEGAPELEKN